MPPKCNLPQQSVLQQILRYEPDTGRLFWLERPAAFFKDGDQRGAWNRRYAGKEAFRTKVTGYLQGKILNDQHLAHRIIWMMMTGDAPANEIDHINGVRSDNRWINLRLVTTTENQMNQKRPINSSSGIIGVSWRGNMGKWRAQIKVGGIKIHLGYFDCIEEASAARTAANIKHGFHKNHGRA